MDPAQDEMGGPPWQTPHLASTERLDQGQPRRPFPLIPLGTGLSPPRRRSDSAIGESTGRVDIACLHSSSATIPNAPTRAPA